MVLALGRVPCSISYMANGLLMLFVLFFLPILVFGYLVSVIWPWVLAVVIGTAGLYGFVRFTDWRDRRWIREYRRTHPAP